MNQPINQSMKQFFNIFPGRVVAL